jgi:hypothetical protein
MTEPVAAAEGIVYVSHHLLYLRDGPAEPHLPFRPGNGLVTADPGVAVVFTGIASGPVTVAVLPRLDPPPPPELADWDEVAEVSLDAPTGHIAVQGPMSDAPDHFPTLAAAGPGAYRVRVHARGRDTAPDQAVFEPVERYLVVTWPAPAAPELVLKQGDRYGAELRRTGQLR